MSRHHQRLKRRRWAHTRRRTLDLGGWRCSSCGAAGRLEVDHLKPLSKGGQPWEASNLQVLCRGCHIAKTRAEGGRELGASEQAWQGLVQELASPNRGPS